MKTSVSRPQNKLSVPRRFSFRSLTLASALWLIAHTPHSVGAEATQEGIQNAKRDYELKVQDHNLALRDYDLKVYGFWLTVGGLLGTGVALVFGYLQYRKADRWKRAEFLAKEMKDFFGDLDVQNVLMMIDWSPRRVNLFRIADTNSKNYPKVTRPLQVSALRPHTLLTADGGSDEEADRSSDPAESESGSANRRNLTFLVEEVRIRDCYDRFLDYLERFASYVESGLISRNELDPYLRYWIDDIVSYSGNPDEAAWTCALLAYVYFYRFERVQALFREYGYDIAPTEDLFSKQSTVVSDKDWLKQLLAACEAARK